MLHGKRQRLSIEDVNMALQARNVQPLYGYDPTEPLNYRQVPNSGIWYVPSEEVDLEAFLQEPVKAPQPMRLTAHWLAVEGVQPLIPENPNLPDRNALGEPHPTATLRRELQDEADPKVSIKHVLSRELQLYHDTIVSDLLGEDERKQQAALEAVLRDAGVQQLVPYLVQFIAEHVPRHLRSLPRLMVLMRLGRSLLSNPHVFCEPYLHQLMPPILTCLLGKRQTDGDWQLRRMAAELVAQVCSTYGQTYSTLLPRVTRTMVKTLGDASKPLTAHYGAIVGLSALGPKSIESLLIPLMSTYLASLDCNSEEGQMVYGAMREAARVWKAEADRQTEECMAMGVPDPMAEHHLNIRQQLISLFDDNKNQ